MGGADGGTGGALEPGSWGARAGGGDDEIVSVGRIEESVMPPAETMIITLPGKVARRARAKVEAGVYASDSDVIREALTVWQKCAAEDEQRLAAIRSKFRAGLMIRGHRSATRNSANASIPCTLRL
jgi:Arc/MetJ-type ribon-helix-helix transcriptional regulator